MKKITLSLETNPWIQAFQMRNYELGIMQEKTPWILSKYINCYYYDKGSALFYHVTDEGNFFQNCGATLVQKFRFDKTILKLGIIDFIKLTEDSLINGWYFTGYFDEYYIKSKKAYNKFHFRHNILVYGFSKEDKVFNAIGYTSKNKYLPFIISYDEYNSAIYSDFDKINEPYEKKNIDKIEFDAFKINPDYEFKFDIKELYKRINDYYNSINSNDINYKGLIYGINSERKFLSYLESFFQSPENSIDVSYSRLYMELKNIMYIRLKYLESISCITPGLSDAYEPLAKKQQCIHLLALKYNLTKNTSILGNTSRLMNEIINVETVILRKVLNDISFYIEKITKEEYF